MKGKPLTRGEILRRIDRIADLLGDLRSRVWMAEKEDNDAR